jgi:hypothetical protein
MLALFGTACADDGGDGGESEAPAGGTSEPAAESSEMAS